MFGAYFSIALLWWLGLQFNEVAAVLFAPTVSLLPAILISHRAKWSIMIRELAKRGHPICKECGYLLRGLPTIRCPEGGTEAS